MNSATSNDETFLRRALLIAEQCRDIVFYGVGSVIVSGNGIEISTGYTGEMKNKSGAGGHAEECAIMKAGAAAAQLAGATLYSTLEPCSERRSGTRSCADLIISAGIARVVYGAREPFDPRLQIDCVGHELLEAAGVRVTEYTALAAECLQSALSKRCPGSG